MLVPEPKLTHKPVTLCLIHTCWALSDQSCAVGFGFIEGDRDRSVLQYADLGGSRWKPSMLSILSADHLQPMLNSSGTLSLVTMLHACSSVLASGATRSHHLYLLNDLHLSRWNGRASDWETNQKGNQTICVQGKKGLGELDGPLAYPSWCYRLLNARW